MPLGYLIVREGDKKRRFGLDSDSACRIGRSDQNTIWLRHDSVSRNHAMVEHSASGSFYLYDLGSRNGTFLNGQRVSAPMALQPGDEIRIGEYTLTFVQEEGAPSSASVTLPEIKSGETLVTVRLDVITVMVADIRGYTELALGIGEPRIAEVMSAFNRESGAVLDQMRTWGQKYIGDAVMAVWVHSKDQPPLQVVLSVLEGLSRVAAIAASLQRRFDLPVSVRVGAGINTGRASLGNIGGAGGNYTALGDVVNKAFRFESCTKELGCDVAFGEDTGEILAQAVDIGKIAQQHSVQLKGYTKPATIYTVSIDSVSELIDGLRERGVRLPSDVQEEP